MQHTGPLGAVRRPAGRSLFSPYAEACEETAKAFGLYRNTARNVTRTNHDPAGKSRPHFQKHSDSRTERRLLPRTWIEVVR
jgi:hypothetical protein